MRFLTRVVPSLVLTLPALLPSALAVDSRGYPATAKTNVVDTYHGVKVEDPYRWLEDDNADATKDWVQAQNAVTMPYLQSLPGRQAIYHRLKTLWNFERYGVPFTEGGRYFYAKNDGLQNQSVIYTVDKLNGEPRVLIDPNALSKDGTVALTGLEVSRDGRLAAYGVARSGSDWQEWRVRAVETGEDLPDTIAWVKFSGASWLKDGSGFFYSRYDAPAEGKELSGANYFHKLHFHKLGTPQSEDELVYHRPDHKEWNFNGRVTDDGHYLIITATEGTDPKNRVLYKDLTSPTNAVQELLMAFDADYTFVGNEGPVFWFKTDHGAPNHRVIALDIRDAKTADWVEIIPETQNKLEQVSLVNEHFITEYLADATSVVRWHSLAGAAQGELKLPGLGTVSGLGGRRGDRETFYSFTSFTTPPTIYRLNLTNHTSELFRKPQVRANLDFYRTEQVFYSSRDGTRMPMFLTHSVALSKGLTHPTLLYGYGGFNISLTPTFSVANLVWMEMGGVYAVPNLRGGGEYGEKWHQAGIKLNKQNVFDDFMAAADWLVTNRYTKPSRLAIAGGSNGGLLVGACMTQRPDLFAAALPAVGVLDMLRFHQFTIGWAWTSDYGSSDNETEFKALYAYSPYHNLKPGTRYPATLITTADHDDRVVPAHSFKFAARLQECQAPGGPPVLIRIETKAGHGAGKPTDKQIEEAADRLAFLARMLGIKVDLPEEAGTSDSSGRNRQRP
ncbi:MAG: prolyl oligopeptidase family serine peptidase [Verrucomicrobia bacterium]|jgi:prolyl oligopeptidase|nr:prolyl oligopeptidase family serine peptidase [Verrucomicrobiota bacterium]